MESMEEATDTILLVYLILEQVDFLCLASHRQPLVCYSFVVAVLLAAITATVAGRMTRILLVAFFVAGRLARHQRHRSTRSNHGNINLCRPRYVQNDDEYSRCCKGNSAPAESSALDILLKLRFSWCTILP